MRSSLFSIGWTRFFALVILPFFVLNTLSVTIAVAASGDEYITGSLDPVIEMVLPESLIPIESDISVVSTGTSLTTETGSLDDLSVQSGMTSTGDTIVDTGSIVSSATEVSQSSIGSSDPIATLQTDADIISSSDNMSIKDGDIYINTGLIIEDIEKRITIEIEKGTVVDTVDASGRPMESTPDQIIVDSTLDANQESTIQRDLTIEKL